MSQHRPVFADLADLAEDDRIAVIGELVRTGKLVAFVIDNDAKADRYIKKLRERFGAEVESRGPGPIKGVVYVKVRPIQQ